MRVTASLSFVIALIVLGITYLLAAFVRLDVVSPRSAIGWYLAGAVFFQLGPQLYQGMNDFRRTSVPGSTTSRWTVCRARAARSVRSARCQSDDLPPLEACDALGPYLPDATPGSATTSTGWTSRWPTCCADGQDVMGYPAPALTACYPAARRAVQTRTCPPHWQFREDWLLLLAHTLAVFWRSDG